MAKKQKIKHFTKSEIKRPSLSLLNHYNNIVDGVNRNSNLQINGNVIQIQNSKGSSYYIKKGGGGSASSLAFCKTDAPNTDEIAAYLIVDLLAWDNAKTYEAGDWIEDAGIDYQSLQDDNLNNVVSDGDWWAAGTKSVTVRCLIHNGSQLSTAEPFLKDGAEILVHKVDDEWICPGFNAAKVIT